MLIWKSGLRPGSRSGCTASTTASKGISWNSSASYTASLVRASTSSKVRSGVISQRTTTVLEKKPMTPYDAGSERPATGIPTTTSVMPVQRCSSTR